MRFMSDTIYSSTMIDPRMKLWPAPHIFEHSKVYCPAASASKMSVASPRPRFGTMTLALEPTMWNPWLVSSLRTRKLDDGAALHFDLRRREGEALGEDANDPAVLRRPLRRGQRDEQGGAGERAAADATGARHQNHHPRPTFRLSRLPKSVLRLRVTE
jgi:hypothetical protein